MSKFPENIMTFDGELRFLSNFYEHPLKYAGRMWKSSEHVYQAMKTLDPVEQKLIAEAGTPGIAKRLGANRKKVTLRKDWESVKVSIMLDILRVKFADPVLEQMLLSTGNVKLYEGNTWGDDYWGVDIYRRVGKNVLGRLLMQIRDEKTLFE